MPPPAPPRKAPPKAPLPSPPAGGGRDDAGPEIFVEPLRYSPGDLIADKVRLLELHGEGGMGTVWRAHHLTLDVDVAVKLLHGDLVSPETSEQLQREAHAAALMEHPSAVRVFDFGRTELGDSYIVMELLRGENLADLFDRKEKLPPAEAVALLLPIASALAAAHARGIVHRDLKPENVVLVDVEGIVVPKVVDFGIAKVEGPGRGSIGDADAIYGSPAYMSPEHVRGDGDVDPRSDVFSLGVLLYEAIAGRRPFDSHDALETLRAIVEDEAEPLDRLGVADADLALIVERAMAKSRVARWPDMRTFGRELASWAIARGIELDVTGASIAAHWIRARGAPVSTSLPPAAPPTSLRQPLGSMATPSAAFAPEPRSRAWPVVAALAAVFIVGGTLVFLIQSPKYQAARREQARLEAEKAAPTPPTHAPSLPLSAPSPSLSPPLSPSPSPSASPRPPVSNQDATACAASILPEDAFEADASLPGLCTERDPLRGAAAIRAEVARHGLLVGRTTEAMRVWASQSWYEMAAFAAVQSACCSPSQLQPLAPPRGAEVCPALGPTLDRIGASVHRGEDPAEALAELRSHVTCYDSGGRRGIGPFASYAGPPGSGAEAAFRRVLGAAIAERTPSP